MTAATQQLERKKITSKKERHIGLSEFLEDYSNRTDGNKYEWNDGKIEITKAMSEDQISIYRNIARIFHQTKVYQEGGTFISEASMKTSEKQLRKPDLAIYLNEQIPKLSKKETQIAPWVGEVISENDKINHVREVVKEYFAAGVQVVWVIFPKSKEVFVFTALTEVKICANDTICSGSPALDGLEIKAKDIFK